MNGTRPQDERLKDLQRRIARQRARHTDGERHAGAQDARAAPHHLVLRLIADMGVALAAGLVLGYGIDAWLDSRPWGMLGGALLGLAAGVRNVLYTADSLQRASRRGKSRRDGREGASSRLPRP